MPNAPVKRKLKHMRKRASSANPPRKPSMALPVPAATASNGRLCVDRFAASAPGEFDLILMDVHMPLMNGYEARRIRAMARPGAGIPILAMAAAFTEDVEMAKQAGMSGHFSKPLDIQHMMQEIKRHLKQ